MAPGGSVIGLLEALLFELSETDAALARMDAQIAVLDPRGMLEGLLAENHVSASAHAAAARRLGRLLYDATRLSRGGQLLHEAVVPPRQRLQVLRRPPGPRDDPAAG